MRCEMQISNETYLANNSDLNFRCVNNANRIEDMELIRN
jgi:hypothetical protein